MERRLRRQGPPLPDNWGTHVDEHVARQQKTLARAVQLTQHREPQRHRDSQQDAIRASAGCRCGWHRTASAVPLCGPSSHLPAQGGSPAKEAGLRSCCRAYDHALPNPHAKGFGFPPQTHHREGRALNSGGTQRVREVASPLPDSGDRTNPNRKAVGAAHTPHGGCLPPDPRAVFKFEA